MTRVSVATMAGVMAVLMTGATQTAEAQAYFQLGAGASIPTGDLKDGLSTGFLGQAAAGIGKGILGGRVSATYIRHGIKDTDFNYRIAGAMADLVVSPRMSGSAKPYFLGGVGVQNEASSQSGSGSDTKFAWNVGAGIGVGGGKTRFFVEARYMTINHEVSDSKVIPITAGVRLGGN